MLVTAFEMGMTEAEFWRMAPRVFAWKIEAFVRQEMRTYVRELHVGAGSKGDYTPKKVVSSLRLYDVTAEADPLSKVNMSEEAINDLMKRINKK